MARKTKEQKAAEVTATAKAEQASGDESAPAPVAAASEEPAQDGPAELSLPDALHQLIDDARMRPHWESSIRKFADNHGLGETASADKWRECLGKYGCKLK